jgi:hypothetical protein
LRAACFYPVQSGRKQQQQAENDDGKRVIRQPALMAAGR